MIAGLPLNIKKRFDLQSGQEEGVNLGRRKVLKDFGWEVRFGSLYRT